MTACRFVAILTGLATLSIGARCTVSADDVPPNRLLYSSYVAVDSGSAGFIAVGHPRQPNESVSEWKLAGPRGDGGSFFLADSKSSRQEAMIDPWEPRVFLRKKESLYDPVRFDSPEVKDLRRFDVAVNPQALAFHPDGKLLLVACDPPGREGRPICFIDLMTGLVKRRTIPGSSNLRGIAVDPEGRFALATHLLPKADLPATQISQGWVFTNAISLVPLNENEPIVTLPLDLRTQAFANPEGVAISSDAKRAYVTHAGADVVSVIDLAAFLRVAEDVVRKSEPVRREGQQAHRSEDLSLPRKFVRSRIPVGSNPRGVAVHFDNKSVVVFNRLDKSVSIIDAAALTVTSTLPVETPKQARAGADDEHLARMGDRLFHSGRLSFSGQFSCASCHPDGHTDGLNWDLPADGFNNFHNTKSLLGSAGTAPYGWNGQSETLKSRFVGTLKTLFQYEPTGEETTALEAYLDQLDYPARLRHRADPKSPATERGRAIFLGVARCHECHSGPRLTDSASHDVGTGSGASNAGDSNEFDTPSLIRVSETGPWLHDGRAETLDAVFREHNSQKRHGDAGALNAAQLDDLIEYLKSL